MSIQSSNEFGTTYSSKSKKIEEVESLYREVSFKQIEKEEKKITQKYEVIPYDFLFKICEKEDRERLLINIVKYHAPTILKAAIIGGVIGSSIGGVVEYYQSKNIRNGIIYGGFCGSTAGVILAGKFAFEDSKALITQSNEFKQWKTYEKKEKYDLFLNFMKNYSEMDGEDFNDIVCPLTYDIPVIPVRSPNGQVYEKEAIEKHLDNAWENYQRCVDSGFSDKKLQEELETICPFRGKSFTKDDLKYASEFAEKVIKRLRELKETFEEIDEENDPIIRKGMNKLYHHYKNNIREVSAQMINELSKDLLELGVTNNQRTQILLAFGVKV